MTRVFVFLPRHLDAELWRRRFELGEVPDRSPYGYHFAEEAGAKLVFSLPTKTSRGVVGLADRAVRRILGFDLRHAWCNRAALLGRSYDVVWTHTEYEHLAVAALRRLSGRNGAPVIAQSVWLMDSWPHFSSLKRRVFSWLMRTHAVATFHSKRNLELAERLSLMQRLQWMPFGISLESFPMIPRGVRPVAGRPLRVLALGNDRHRDWDTLFRAVAGQGDLELRVGSSCWPRRLVAQNITVEQMSQQRVRESYDWADCAVVPLHPNLHASGLTAMLESVAMGVPVVVTATGGLEDYFDDTEVNYVPVGDPDALRERLCAIQTQVACSEEQVCRAQARLIERELTTKGFAMRHLTLSEALVSSACAAHSTPADKIV